MSSSFNKRNRLGKRCIFALIPGWDEFFADSGTTSGQLRSIGQRMQFDLEAFGGPSSGGVTKITRNYGGGIGTVRAARIVPEGGSTSYRFLRSTADEGIIFKDNTNLTILGIFREFDDNTDSRVFAKDEGSAAAQHDLMIGMVGGLEARTRIRIGSSVQTVATTGSVIQFDAVNLIAGTVEPASATNSIVRVHHLALNGIYSTAASSSVTGAYNPRTTTNIAIGATAGGNDNALEAEIIGIWAFDGAFTETDLRAFFANPWQVFAPRRIYVPLIPGVEDIILPQSLTASGAPFIPLLVAEGVAQSTTVIITDVNTTESWQDGSTNIPITGTGFV